MKSKQQSAKRQLRRALAQAAEREELASILKQKGYWTAIRDAATLTPKELRATAERAEVSLQILDGILGAARSQGEPQAI